MLPAVSAEPAPLRRELGRLESYAAMVGILVGAGIFRVTSDAWQLTGPSVILGYAVLTVPILATAVGYMVFLSTPLGEQPGGEYTHLSRTFGGFRLAFVAAWLKVVSFIGALAYLANALADYFLQLTPSLAPEDWRLPIALLSLAVFWGFHVVGVRWFGRVQVLMFAILALSLAVLIVPGVFAIDVDNYQPFFSAGVGGFAESLPPLFFAFAGFEAVAHTAGELKDSRSQLPALFLRGILITTGIFVAMSVVTFGVLPGNALAGSTAPMSEVAAVYLPAWGAGVVTVGALMALATSLNATMFVPSRIAVMLVDDGLAPRWLGAVNVNTGTPILALTLTFVLALALLVSGQVSLALNIAVTAMMLLYLLHSVALLALPRTNPTLNAGVQIRLSSRLRTAAAVLSVVILAGMLLVSFIGEIKVLGTTSFVARVREGSLTSLELLIAWAVAGALLYWLARGKGSGRVPPR
jgi:amino acid transporter